MMNKIRRKITYIREYFSVVWKPKVLFIWIPKNAGTSTFEALHDSINMKMFLTKKEIIGSFTNQGAVTFGHIGVKELIKKNIIKKNYYHKSYVFCISRNPYDRFVSLFYYLKKQNRIPEDYQPIDLITRIMNGIPPVGFYNFKDISQCNPQVDWIDGLKIDKVLRFENLEEDTIKLSQELGVKIALPHENQSINRSNFYEELDEKTIELVQEYYKEDFVRFNYPLQMEL